MAVMRGRLKLHVRWGKRPWYGVYEAGEILRAETLAEENVRAGVKSIRRNTYNGVILVKSAKEGEIFDGREVVVDEKAPGIFPKTTGRTVYKLKWQRGDLYVGTPFHGG